MHNFCHRRILFVACTLFLSSFAYSQKKVLTDYVDPLIGTAIKGDGGTAPFVGPPFSMTNFLVQTRENKMGRMPYAYDDSYIMGFMASHQPTVWMGDYGYLSVMPQIGKLRVLPEERKLKFKHESEISRPYCYSVDMYTNDNHKINGQITATSHCGLFRFIFPASDNAHFIIQAININPDLSDWCNNCSYRQKRSKGWVKIDTINNEIVGYNSDRMSAQLGPELSNFKGYFIIKFSKKITKHGIWNNMDIFPNIIEGSGTRMGAYITFKTKRKEIVYVKIATSFISLDQARKNMSAEIPGWNFQKIKKLTKQQWENKLSKIQVSGLDKQDNKIFYTALYHCYLFPREFSEYGKYYSAFDDKIHNGISYTDFSLWDTFRAFHPLMTLLEPGLTCDWITALLQMYKEGGRLPMWPNPAETNIMIGTHADAVIADAYMKGLRNYDTDLAYEAVRKDAMIPPDYDTRSRYEDRAPWISFEGRAGASYYHTIGYVPDDMTAESVSRTMEYAYDDWCIAMMAKDKGKICDYKQLINWSLNYRNLYNKDKGFMLPRKYNGDWIDVDDSSFHGFTEGPKWTYLFFGIQDIPGMIDMHGGKKAFAAKLDRNFNENHYRHDNEPGHHYAYLYDYCGEPSKTQDLIRKLTRENYSDTSSGINGNDDCGQMSAWYIFSVLGFYPVTPGSNEFAIGAPQIPQADVRLTVNGKSKILRIIAENLSEQNKYVQAVYLDGKKLNCYQINYFDLINASELKYEMGSKRVDCMD